MKRRPRSTKIVATVGPASRTVATLERMVAAGMDLARLNFAHGSTEEHAETVEMLRRASENVGREIGVLQDIPGPKLRLGPVQNGVCELRGGSRVVLTPESIRGTSERLPVAWHGFSDIVSAGDLIYLADGAMRLRVQEISGSDVVARIEVGGQIASGQGVNLPNVTLSLPAVGAEDLDHIEAGVQMGVDVVALSFVRQRQDVEAAREHLMGLPHGGEVPLIAKIEKPQAAANAVDIIDAADGIMVARGDLGIELPIEEVPLVQKRLIELCGQRSKPSITATQMLESMVSASRPTRAEVADVANAIFDGTDAVMLSQETAIGRYPVEAIAMMSAIAESTERELPYGRWLLDRGVRGGDDSAAIATLAVSAVEDLDLKAIVAPTRSGRIARLISGHRPRVPVLALCPELPVVRRCALLWGVHAELFQEPNATSDLLDAAGMAARDFGIVQSGDKIGVTAGLPPLKSGGTNLFKVQLAPCDDDSVGARTAEDKAGVDGALPVAALRHDAVVR
jgi:pyruvate kinase